MALLTWTETYAVKVRAFDQQHRRLFDLINVLHEAMKEGRGSEIVKPVLLELVKYTEDHFAAEESVMQRAAFPGFSTHRQEHIAFTDKVRAFAVNYQAGRAALSTPLMHFLRDWLEKHIRGTDQKYTTYLNAKGIA